jgi:hypothetical protein
MFVGRPFHLDYSTALLLIADAWKQKAQGIPQGCFLLAYYDNESLQSELSMRLHTAEEEANNPTRADKQIEDAFRRVREYLRDKDPKGLWFHHNIEYGFSRNLLGSRLLWAIVAAAGTLFAVIHGIKTAHGPLNPASLMNLLSFVCAVYIGWGVLPGATKLVADGYAEAAWMAFLPTADEASSAVSS